MRIAQITDPHLTVNGSVPGGYDPEAALGSVLSCVLSLDPAPDLVVFTGDLAHSGAAEEYDRFCAVVAEFPLPMAAIPGNHDERAAFALGLEGSGIAMGEGAFLQFALEGGPVRVIGLDTVDPEDGAGGRLCEARLDWLAARLAEDARRPAIVFMHHPPFRIGQPIADGSNCADGDRLAAMLAGNPQVLAVACGHVHRGAQVAFAGTLGLVCPSVAWEVPLDTPEGVPFQLVRRPPAFQLFDWSPALGLATLTIRLPDAA